MHVHLVHNTLSSRPMQRCCSRVCMPHQHLNTWVCCRVLAHRQRTAKELELEEQLRFEAYRCACARRPTCLSLVWLNSACGAGSTALQPLADAHTCSLPACRRDLVRLKCLGLSGAPCRAALRCLAARPQGCNQTGWQSSHSSVLPPLPACSPSHCGLMHHCPCPFTLLAERQGIAHAEQENVAIRAASRAAAVAALEAAKGPKPLPSQSSLFAGSGANAIPAGTGQFAAVGFSYGGSEGGGGGGDDEEEEEEEEESDEDDVPATAGGWVSVGNAACRSAHCQYRLTTVRSRCRGPLLAATGLITARCRGCGRIPLQHWKRLFHLLAPLPLPALPAAAEDADMDRSALKEFGLEDFSSMLRWAMREEAEEAAAVRRRKRYTGWGRKKASIR